MAKRIRYEDKNPEPLIPAKERVKSFREYALGYALDEITRVGLARSESIHEFLIKEVRQ